jgi:hypothetical protein
MGMDGVESDAKNVVDGIVLNPMKTQFHWVKGVTYEFIRKI